MRIVSTTIAGPGTEGIIGDAVRSVSGWIDGCVLIWTGVDPPDMDTYGPGFDVLRIVGQEFGGPVIARHFPWCDDFATARNAALAVAEEMGALWALTLDTDERIDLGGEDLSTALSAGCGSWLVRDVGTGALKERLIRLPAAARWHGRTHEYYPVDPRGRGTLGRMTYRELPKTPEQNAAKFARDESLLRAQMADEPEESRWPFYLGVTLRGRGYLSEAAEMFRRAMHLSRWATGEEGAWAAWEASRCLLLLGRASEALDACCAGLARHPGIAELCHGAALACVHLGRRDHARYWAQMAKVHGEAGDRHALSRRILWRYPPALWSGPDELLATLGVR